MQQVFDYLKQYQKRFLAEFCDYLRFPSVSAQSKHDKDLLACAEWLVAHCRQIGLNAANTANPAISTVNITVASVRNRAMPKK